MAFGTPTTFLNANSKTAAAVWDTALLSIALSAGNYAWIVVAFDNISGADGNTNDCTSIELVGVNGTDTFIKGYEYTNAAGAAVAVWYCKLQFSHTTASGFNIAFSASVAAKGAVGATGTMGSGTLTLEGNVSGENTRTVPDFTGMAAREHLLLAGFAIEDNENCCDSYTGSSTGGILDDSAAFTTGGGSAANMSCGSAWRIVNTSGTIAGPSGGGTASGDAASVGIALYEAAVSSTLNALGWAAGDGDVNENAPNGTVVGNFTGKTSGASYSLSDNAGGRFAIDASTAEVTVADTSLIDYEVATSHSITVVETLAGATNSPNSTVLTVTVNNVADETAPTITSSNAVSVEEDATLAHTLTADEAVSTWSISGGADAAQFEIATDVLRWSANGTRDFEAPADADANNVYVVTVTATDAAGNVSAAQTINVTVTDVADPTTVTYTPNLVESHSDFAVAPTTTNLAAQDADWATAASNTAAPTMKVSFPEDNYLEGANLQTIRIEARKNSTGTGNPTFTISILDAAGATVATSGAFTVDAANPTAQVFDYPFNSALFAGNDFSVVVTTTAAGGSPSVRNSLDFGYVALIATLAAAVAMYRGVKTRSEVYLGVKTDAEIYKGAEQLF